MLTNALHIPSPGGEKYYVEIIARGAKYVKQKKGPEGPFVIPVYSVTINRAMNSAERMYRSTGISLNLPRTILSSV